MASREHLTRKEETKKAADGELELATPAHKAIALGTARTSKQVQQRTEVTVKQETILS